MNATAENMPTTQVERPRTEGELAFALTVKKARALASSTLVPKEYQGEDGLANVMLAMEVARRTGANELMVMQNLYVVHGRPSWSSSFLIATVNACGRFTPLRFESVGDDPAKDDYRVRAVAKDKESGEECTGAWITWAMVKAEGWHSKNGSKWKTMPEQMFRYRAASFWTRLYAPELSLGIYTADEVQDTWGTATVHQAPTNPAVADLSDRLKARAIERQPESAEPAQPELPSAPAKTVKEIRAALHEAESVGALRALDADIEAIPDDAEREELKVLQDSRFVALA